MFTTIVEQNTIDYSRKYRFNPAEHARCQMTREGKICLNRRLVKVVLGINFPKTNMKIVELIQENGQLCRLLIKPVSDAQPDEITLTRFKHGGLLKLDRLFDKLNLDYKCSQFSFISEPVSLNDGSVGICLTLHDRKLWPQFDFKRHTEPHLEESQAYSGTEFEESLDVIRPQAGVVHQQQMNEEELVQTLSATILTWKRSQQNLTDAHVFEQNFIEFRKRVNQMLLAMTLPDLLVNRERLTQLLLCQ